MNTADDGEQRTKALFRAIALERDGYYDARPGGRPRLSIWQGRVRRIVEGILDGPMKARPAPRRLLDAGCGRGDFTLALARRYPQLAEIVGCDFSPELIELARSSAAGEPRVRFLPGDLTALPFEAESFDATVCLNVLHHVSRERLPAALAELGRVSAHTLVLEIKNARSLYFRLHSRRVEGVPIYPATIEDIEAGLSASGLRLVDRRAIFVAAWLSPLVVFRFERRQRDPLSKARLT